MPSEGRARGRSGVYFIRARDNLPSPGLALSLSWAHPQAWKNATMAEQAKLPATEKPVLLSKDIEAKMMALDREVQYLLNKAKFTKPRPRPKDKNATRAEPPLNASASDQAEKVIPPPGQTEDAKPISEPEKETGELKKVIGNMDIAKPRGRQTCRHSLFLEGPQAVNSPYIFRFLHIYTSMSVQRSRV